MSSPYVGEIRIFAGNFAPYGWMFCDGSLLSIPEYETLFNLIGTTYGGDGQSTFALPDLRGRLPLHFGNGFTLAETGGVETVTLTVSQIPAHSHALLATTNPAAGTAPSGNVAPAVAATLGFAACLAISSALRQVSREAVLRSGGSSNLDFSVKWPNDVLAGGR